MKYHWYSKVIIQCVNYRFMSDQEAWHELCDLYLQEQEYSKAAFCMEELILHNPHSHLIYQRYAEIKYSQVKNSISLFEAKNFIIEYLLLGWI